VYLTQLRDAAGDAVVLILKFTFLWLAECKMLWRGAMSLYATKHFVYP